MLDSGKKQRVTYTAEFNFHLFFKRSRGTQIFDMTFEWRHCWNESEPGSNPGKDTSTQCLCINISKTIESKSKQTNKQTTQQQQQQLIFL